ncbi:MAG: cytochrome c3 family protein [Eggerthellaceae bacterium]|nr:cytochrome c3 family protein [Eggerthellaceae bacterium]
MTNPDNDRPAGEAPASESSPRRPAARRRRVMAAAVVALVLVAAGAGFWVWHEQPGFCNAICHNPMDPYLPTYEAEPGQPSVDKWGNEVQDAAGMMAAAHRAQNDDTCLSCHVPTLGEQVSEGLAWVAGNYYDPLDERSVTDLTAARGVAGDEFCLNEACHDLTRPELVELTADRAFNPHVSQHDEYACSDCHKAHRASVMICAQCHTEAEVPAGWIQTVDDAQLMKPISVPDAA